MNPFSRDDIIESTAYSVVVKITHKEHGLVVIKFIKDKKHRALLENELVYLKKLHPNPNVIKVYGIYKDPKEFGIVMEYMRLSLKEVIRTKTYRAQEMYKWFYQVCSVFAILHKIGHLHRDIKPGNLLLDDTLETMKVIDFGISRKDSKKDMSTQRGSWPYMAPEVSNKSNEYDSSADVYSLGITILVTATKQSETADWKNGSWDKNKKITDHPLKAAVDRMLNQDSRKRPLMAQLRNYFEQLIQNNCDESLLENKGEEYEVVEIEAGEQEGEIVNFPYFGQEHFEENGTSIKLDGCQVEEVKRKPASYHKEELKLLGNLVAGNADGCKLMELRRVGNVVLKEWWSRNGVKVATADLLQSHEIGANLYKLLLSPHMHILTFYGTAHDSDAENPYAVLVEYMEGGSIYDCCEAVRARKNKKRKTLNSQLFNKWGFQLATAISFLHHIDIYHHKVTPENIFLTKDWQTVKLGCIGWAEAIDCIPPKVLGLDGGGSPADVLSFGKTFAYIHAIDKNNPSSLQQSILRRLSCIPPRENLISEDVKELIESCCAEDSSSRPTAMKVADILREITTREEKN